MRTSMVLVVLAMLVVMAVVVRGHQALIDPMARTGASNPNSACLVNGILMGDRVGVGSNGEPVQSSSRDLVVNPHPYYNRRPCGRCGQARFKETVEACTNPDSAFDVSKVGSQGVKQYTAGSEVTLTFKGYFHPGVLSIRICYENCMDMSSYEKYILGYWFMEGTGGPNSDIYKPTLTAKVKIPNRNCDRCVMQFMSDTLDLRSYVNCADIKIVGASSTAADEVTCNGHPYCDCRMNYAQNVYGLGKKCPVGLASSGKNHALLSQISSSDFCKFCIGNGCPSTCGGVWQGTYNGANTKGGSHSSGLPQYTTCSATNPCNCPGCSTQATYTKPSTGSTAGTWSPRDWSACSVSCGVGTQTRVVVCLAGGQQVDASRCSGSKPVTQQACEVGASCSAVWLTSPFNACTTSTNRMTRSVYCVDAGSIVDPAQCSSAKPATALACNAACEVYRVQTAAASEWELQAVTHESESESAEHSSGAHTNTTVIAVGVALAGLFALLLVVGLGVFLHRRRRQHNKYMENRAQVAPPTGVELN